MTLHPRIVAYTWEGGFTKHFQVASQGDHFALYCDGASELGIFHERQGSRCMDEDEQRDDQPASPIIITLPPLSPPRSTVIPGAGKLRQAAADARTATHRRVQHALLIALAMLLVSVTFSVVSLSNPTHLAFPWNASNSVFVVTPGPIGSSRPNAAGPHDFLCVALPFARQAQEQMIEGGQALAHPWYISVILAQWGVEQGWVMPAYTGYNFGNVSAINRQPSVSGLDVPGSPHAFAYAATAEQGVADYVLFSQNGLYRAVDAAWSLGPTGQAIALGASPWDAGHYTGIAQPGSTLLAVMQTYQLTRFDQVGAIC